MEPIPLSYLNGASRARLPTPMTYRTVTTLPHYKTGSQEDEIPLVEPRDSAARLVGSNVADSSRRSRKLQGPRLGLAIAFVSTFCVLLVNIAVAVSFAQRQSENGIVTFSETKCTTAYAASSGIHFLINVLSGLLLAASTYSMQCLSSPTRQDIDRAHLRGQWVDVGVFSIRNLSGKISVFRIAGYVLLAICSMAISLVYNSSVFQLVYTNPYRVMIVEGDYPIDSLSAKSLDSWPQATREEIVEMQTWFVQHAEDSSLVQNLTQLECISAYYNYNNSLGTSSRTDVMVFLGHETADQSDDIVDYGTASANYDWICIDNTTMIYPHFPNLTWHNYTICDPLRIERDMQNEALEWRNWTIGERKVNNCLSRLQSPRCRLQFSFVLLAIVISCNVIQLCLMLLTVICLKRTTLVTLGDTISSFLLEPDATTRSRCWLDKKDVVSSDARALTGLMIPPPRSTECHHLLWSAASTRRWMIAVVLGAFAFLIPAITGFISGRDGYLSIDSGTRETTTVFTSSAKGHGGLVPVALGANAIQLMLSLLYVACNGLLTSMLQAEEWNSYYLRKGPLRVSFPSGQQLSTSWLQVPHKYSLSLLGFSILVHWLASQSLFLTRAALRDGENVGDEVSLLGYASLPTLLLGCCGIPLLLSIARIAGKELNWQMPLVGSCSLAISAACHRPADDINAAYGLVSWGEIPDEEHEDVGHCTFTSYEVRRVIADKLYA